MCAGSPTRAQRAARRTRSGAPHAGCRDAATRAICLRSVRLTWLAYLICHDYVLVKNHLLECRRISSYLAPSHRKGRCRCRCPTLGADHSVRGALAPRNPAVTGGGALVLCGRDDSTHAHAAFARACQCSVRPNEHTRVPRSPSLSSTCPTPCPQNTEHTVAPTRTTNLTLPTSEQPLLGHESRGHTEVGVGVGCAADPVASVRAHIRARRRTPLVADATNYDNVRLTLLHARTCRHASTRPPLTLTYKP